MALKQYLNERSRAPDTIDPAPVQRSSRRQNRAAGAVEFCEETRVNTRNTQLVDDVRTTGMLYERIPAPRAVLLFAAPRNVGLTNWNTTGPELGESFHASRGRQVEGKQR